jgi:Carbohydrate family 9 binding domain-like
VNRKNQTTIAILVILIVFNVFRAIPRAQAGHGRPAYSSTNETQAKRANADFDVDANVMKKAWRNVPWAKFDHDVSGQYRYPDLATRVAATWTDNYIYFAFSCHFDRLNTYEGEDTSKQRWELWNRDVVEVFVNPRPEHLTHYYEFEVAPNNQWIDLEIEKKNNPFNDAGWNSGFSHASKVDSQKRIWTVEMRIPLKSMKVMALTAGSKWRVNFFRAAGQGTDEHRHFLSWSTIPSGATFHVPERFGTLVFVD